MAESGTAARISQAEIAAGIFFTFCLALFIAMLFVLGKSFPLAAWRGHTEIRVLFTQVGALRRDAPVRYNGMDLGRVQSLEIIHAARALLSRLAPLTRRDLPNLPLTEEEREQLLRVRTAGVPPAPDAGETPAVRGFRGHDPDFQTAGQSQPPAGSGVMSPEALAFDKKVRALLEGRTMVLLTLDVLSESDSRRFHEDDEYRIAGSLMGDSAVEIRTGSGAPVAVGRDGISPHEGRGDRIFLGLGGDMYTDLGKSIAQVKDILASMADIVGGEKERATIRGQVQAFESYTGRIESAAGSIETKLAQTWDNLDARLDDGGKTLGDVEAKLKDLRPKVDSALESANKSILEARESLTKSVDSAREKVRSLRKDAADRLGEWRTQAAEYKDSIPPKIRSAREWSERFILTADKIDNFLTRADDQLDKGIASTRATLAGYVVSASELEEKTYRLKRWPSSFARKPGEEAAQQEKENRVWRRDLARRQYVELRAELERLRQGLLPSATQASDRERLARVEQIIREADEQLESAAQKSGERRKKGGK